MNIQSVLRMNTAYNADCIDFCPIESFEHILVVGTYQLEEKLNDQVQSLDEDKCSNERIGRLYLLTFDSNKLTVLQEIDMPGILDVRWCKKVIQGKIILGLVNAKGNFLIYSLEDNHLKEIQNINVSGGLALYFDWSNKLSESQSPNISVSDSKGLLSIYSLDNLNVELQQVITAHRYEAWVTSFNFWNTSLIYSGADDSLFKGFDVRSKAVPVFSSKVHEAGVTAIEHSLWKENLLFSGCYNGDLNSWDIRNMKTPISNTNLGGGIWRLRCEPHSKPLILTSTMHNGFHVLETNNNDNCEVIGTYSKHESLAYGADWSLLKIANKYLVGSISFYDKLMCLWEFDY